MFHTGFYTVYCSGIRCNDYLKTVAWGGAADVVSIIDRDRKLNIDIVMESYSSLLPDSDISVYSSEVAFSEVKLDIIIQHYKVV